VLVLSGGIDDAHGNQTELEINLNNASADWEVTRYAQVEHGYTVWGGDGYNLRADARSWESMMLAFEELLPLTAGTPDTESPSEVPPSTSAAFPSFVGSFSISYVTVLAMIFFV
jgi:hypothetical protein